ncbi:MAG: 50S ribosomal protein L5 [Verrucomicrobia bacterium GWF2_51_19]|nr:MAG: 50S ribosomal protein L5 [Verrucomicrobia bacterium GWF2_51_19]HCJ12583.1 50S ribosomal protein L5 [Opitutae bacterium]
MKLPELKKHYLEVVVPELRKTRGYSNIHEVPAIEKIVLNTGIAASDEKNRIAEIEKELTAITGQKPIITKASKSISNFKLRQGMPNGVKVTLRGNAMYNFLLRLLAVALPAIRDFRGVSSKLDGHGNYSIGISDHSIFPEIQVDGNRKNIGMDITIVTTAKTNEDGFALLELMGMPFRKN